MSSGGAKASFSRSISPVSSLGSENDLVPASRNRGGFEVTVTRVFRRRPSVPARFKACPHQL